MYVNVWSNYLFEKSNYFDKFIYKISTNEEKSQSIDFMLRDSVIQETFINRKFTFIRRFDTYSTDVINGNLYVLHEIQQKFKRFATVICGFGTALGYAREMKPIDFDFDFDLILVNDTLIPKSIFFKLMLLKIKISRLGYKSINRFPNPEITCIANNIKIDIFLSFNSKNKITVWPGCREAYLLADLIPPRKIKVLDEIELNFPRKLETYLTATYGDTWQTPNKNWNWNFSTEIISDQYTKFDSFLIHIYDFRTKYFKIMNRFKHYVVVFLLNIRFFFSQYICKK